MSSHLLRALVVAAALPAALPIAAQLTLDQATERAVLRSEATRAARAGTASADEAARAAGQLPDPMLSLGIDNLPLTAPNRLSTTADSMTMKRVGISQEWLSQDKRSVLQAAARAAADREAVNEQSAVAQTRLQTALAYLDAYYAGETLKLTRLTEHHLQEELDVARGRMASPAGSSQDVLAMASARGMAQDASAEIQQTQAAATVALQRWVGPTRDALAPPILPTSSTELAYVAAHPSVLTAQRDIELARQEAAVAAAKRKPNWTWQVAYGQRSGYSDMVSFGVSIPLPVSPPERQDRDTASKLALVEKAEASLEEAARAATAEFHGLSSDAHRLGERIERFRLAVLTPAQQRTQAALAGYRSNQVAITTVFEARHAEVEVLRKLLMLQRDLAKTQAQLAYTPLLAGGHP